MLPLKRAQHIAITLSRFRSAREPERIQRAIVMLDEEVLGLAHLCWSMPSASGAIEGMGTLFTLDDSVMLKSGKAGFSQTYLAERSVNRERVCALCLSKRWEYLVSPKWEPLLRSTLNMRRW